MKKSDLRIIYMGTPEFAVQSLKELVENDYQVVAVVTMPDKPIGRGYKLQSSAVKMYAQTQNIPVLQPTNLKDVKFFETLRSYQADLQIVVAFRMLPESVWAMPRLGTFNLHASLLPQYRGAAPINWAIINGEKQSGVTTFFLQHAIDTGNIILQERVSIFENENAGSLHDRLMLLGAKVVKQTVDLILLDKVIARPQLGFSMLKTAPKIFRETCRINWENDAKSIHDFVRGLSPYPGAWFEWKISDEPISEVKVYETRFELCEHSFKIGTILVEKNLFKVAVKDGFISIYVLQIAGKKRMNISEFLRGFKNIHSCKINL